MENKMLALKVYDVDYSFIIKNYLDEKLWDKEWTIFTYKRFKVTLRLNSIDVVNRRIWFEVILDDNTPENKDYFGRRKKDTFSYTLSIENVKILKSTLNYTIFKLIKTLEEESYISYSQEYLEIKEMEYEEIEKLKNIANDFLDSEGVYNDEIREAYIEYYVDSNKKVDKLKGSYLEKKQYCVLTDFFVAFLQAANDTERLEIVAKKIGQDELNKILKEIQEYKEYMQTDDFIDEMQDNLEDI